MKKLACMILVAGLMTAPAAWADDIDLLNPVLRLVADDLSATYADGNDVDAWTDRVWGMTLVGGADPHNGYAGTWNGPLWPNNSPTYKTGIMNGHDVVRFVAAEGDAMDHMDFGTDTTLRSSVIWDEQTIVIVYSKTAADVDSNMLMLYTSNDAGQTYYFAGIGTERCFWGSGGTQGNLVGHNGSFSGGAFSSTYTVPNDGSVQWASWEFSVGSNLKEIYAMDPTTPVHSSAGVTSPTGNEISLGTQLSWQYDAARSFDGDIAEIIILDYVPTALQRQTIANYISATYLVSIILGDMDGSGEVNNDDITPFVLALTDPATYEATYGMDPDVVGDIDASGVMNNDDITPFVTLLTSGGQPVPEPATLALLGVGVAGLLARRRR